MVCEIIVSHIITIVIEIYIKHKISLLRDRNMVYGYEGLDDLDVSTNPLEKSRVVKIRIRKDPLN